VLLCVQPKTDSPAHLLSRSKTCTHTHPPTYTHLHPPTPTHTNPLTHPHPPTPTYTHGHTESALSSSDGQVDVTVMEVSVCYWRADPKRYDARAFAWGCRLALSLSHSLTHSLPLSPSLPPSLSFSISLSHTHMQRPVFVEIRGCCWMSRLHASRRRSLAHRTSHRAFSYLHGLQLQPDVLRLPDLRVRPAVACLKVFTMRVYSQLCFKTQVQLSLLTVLLCDPT
jgi:hypothetical protein